MYLKDVSEVRDADEAREIAIEWQHTTSNEPMSWMEVANYTEYFRALANKFNLTEEFKENAII